MNQQQLQKKLDALTAQWLEAVRFSQTGWTQEIEELESAMERILSQLNQE